jgi:WhiB family transcriptional regulator, redox-sensing transcriptional regulator
MAKAHIWSVIGASPRPDVARNHRACSSPSLADREPTGDTAVDHLPHDFHHPRRSLIFMDWRDRAACLEEDPELFFPIGNTGPAILQIEEAKAVCRRCEVIDTCLKWALETGQDAGVWGGLSEDERRALKRRNARARRAG